MFCPRSKPATLKKLGEVMPSWAPVRNPIDTWSAIEQHGSKKATSHIARCLMDQKDIDALLITFVLMPESMFDISEAFAEIFSRHPDKPVFASYYGGTAREIAHIHEGFAALGRALLPHTGTRHVRVWPHGGVRPVPRNDPQMIFDQAFGAGR